MSALRRAARAAAVVLAAGAGFAAGRRLYRDYRADMQRAYDRLEGADTVETSVGAVEYRIEGEGVPVLVSHGIVGGFDQALGTGQSLLEADARLVGASRFGYLGSDLPPEPTPANQARAYAELLDDVGIDDAVVVGTSAGGAPAIRFALDYPDRTRGLVLIGSTAPSQEEIEGATGPPHAILRDPVFWLLVARAPWVFLRLFGVDPAVYASAPREQRRRVETLLETLIPVEPRKPGIYNDERVTNTAMVEHFEKYDLEAMAVPALVIHARDDPLASFEDAKRMAGRIPDAEFRGYDTGGHLVFGHGDEIRRRVTDFARKACGERRPRAPR